MKILSNRYEILNSSDSEIISFFKTSSFRGLYMPLSDEESAKFAWACGKVSNTTINGQVNDLCPKIIFVPKQFEAYVTQGPCEFNAIVDLKALRSVNQSYRLLIKRIQNVSVVCRLSLMLSLLYIAARLPCSRPGSRPKALLFQQKRKTLL